MQQALRHEAEYFDEKKRLLRAIFNETLAQCVEACHSKHVSKDKFHEMCLKKEDERYIRNMIENPVSIVLLGNRPCVKARIANYILGYELLPVFDFYDPDYAQPRRSVRIIYGHQRRHAFCIRHFELLECVPLPTERVVSFEDLRLDQMGSLLGMAGNFNSIIDANTPRNTSSNTLANTSGHGSNGEQSVTPSMISLASSSSTNSHRMALGTSSSSAFSSHGPSSPSGLSHHVRAGSNFEYRNEDDDDDDDEEFGELEAVNDMTTLEIILPHELLEKNLEIRVAPDVENFDVIYKSTFHKTNAIIIYCFERHDDQLSATDVAHLDQLRQLMPSSPILFAHIVDFDPTYHTCMAVNSKQQNYFHTNLHHHSSPHSHIPTPTQPPLSPMSTHACHVSNSACHHAKHSSNGSKKRSNSNSCQSPELITQSKSQQSSTCSQYSRSELTESQQQWGLHHYQSHAYHHHQHPKHKCYRQLSSTSAISETDSVAAGVNDNDRGHSHFVRRSSNESDSSSESSSDKQSKHQCCHQEATKSAMAHGASYLDASEALWRQLRDLGFFQETGSTAALQAPFDRQQKRLSNGYYIINDRPFKCVKQNADYGIDVRSRFLCHSYEFCYFVDFFRAILKSNLVVAATLLNEIHNQFIQYFIFSAFDMTWNLSYSIPKRLEYARNKEAELYMSLMGIAIRKQDEIRQLIGEMVEFMRDDILEQASAYIFSNPCLNQPVSFSATQIKDCIEEIQEFVFVLLNRAIAVKLISSVDVMRETFIGTLQRCLLTLESSRPVKENEKLREEDKIDYALSRLLDSAYSIEINVNTCNSILRIFWERVKHFFFSISYAWRTSCVVDAEWKRKVAADLVDNLSESKLAKCICTQFRDKLKTSHDKFIASLASLESVLTSKMRETDNRRQQVRKTDAPLFARLALESTSFIDAILYGVPELSKEIGRGQYGVVFSTKKSWGNYNRIAVKSIMICDDKHWNDLAMEFYYARSLPENDRIVQIRGSIIEHNYNGSSSYVYLIMERLTRDLYTGLKAGLDWQQRLIIALDVVHGLRFLHNHGLIHRDIKLKNVLLDKYNRAKITDLGFCKSEVMISGSIVGTPIHMAPEVFTGKYDSMVDVYAFGILFWYICSGSVELPQIFEQCHNKDHLWMAVKKGLRPEKLLTFDDQCYELMGRCWAGDPLRRPLLGEVENILNQIMARYPPGTPPPGTSPQQSQQRHSVSPPKVINAAVGGLKQIAV